MAATAASAATYQNSYANSSTGVDDPNTCGSVQAPCKHIKDAIKNTSAGGTLTLTYADPADIDTATFCHMPYEMPNENINITKPITIQADSALKTKPCFSTGSLGVDIEAKVDIYLKGLRFVGGPGASIGVSVNKGAQLYVNDCYFLGMFHGITLLVGSANIVSSTFNDIADAILMHDPLGKPESVTVTGSHFIKIKTQVLTVQKSGTAVFSMNDLNIRNDLFKLPAGFVVKDNFNTVTRY